MKYTIQGFSQAEILKMPVRLGLDHLAILRWFVDFRGTTSMTKVIIAGEEYYWISYKKIIDDLPILDISKDRVYRKLKELVDCKILKHMTIKEHGTFSYYTLGDRYQNLISMQTNESSNVNPPLGENNEPSVKITEGYGKNNGGGTVKITEGYGKNNGAKIYLLNNTSIKDTSIKNNIINNFDYSEFNQREIDTINEWFEYKKDLGKAYKTKQGLTRIKNEMLKLKNNNVLIDAIHYSIAQEYAGLFAPTNNNYAANKQNTIFEALKTKPDHGKYKISPLTGERCLYDDEEEE